MKKTFIRTLIVFGLIFALTLFTSCKPKPDQGGSGGGGGDKTTYTITYELNGGELTGQITSYDGTAKIVLPTPTKMTNVKGKPRMWSDEQIEELRQFQTAIVRGRNGVMAKVTNPKSRRRE
jgi:hypothetical protein